MWETEGYVASRAPRDGVRSWLLGEKSSRGRLSVAGPVKGLSSITHGETDSFTT